VGLKAIDSSWFGMAGNTVIADWMAYDPRISVTGDWKTNVNKTVGGQFPFLPTGGSGSLRFTPGATTDTVSIFLYSTPASGKVNVSAGASNVIVGTKSADVDKVLKIDFPYSAGTSCIEVTPEGSTGVIYVMGMDAYNSCSPAISVINVGWSGSKLENWMDSRFPLSPFNMLGRLAPDMTTLDIGTNDMNVSDDVAGFMSQYQSLVNMLSMSGDVCIQSAIQSDPSSFSTAENYHAFTDAMKALAMSSRRPFISNEDIFGGYSAAKEAGYVTDARHRNTLGNCRLACVHTSILQAIS
jgi:hypothetical protein